MSHLKLCRDDHETAVPESYPFPSDVSRTGGLVAGRVNFANRRPAAVRPWHPAESALEHIQAKLDNLRVLIGDGPDDHRPRAA